MNRSQSNGNDSAEDPRARRGSEQSPFDLRAEMLPASEMSPDKPGWRSRLRLDNPRRLLMIIIMVVVLALGWLIVAGPGAPLLEGVLANLVGPEPTPTSTSVPFTATVTEVALEATSTPTEPSATPRPSPTTTPTVLADLPTPTETTTSLPTPVDGCVDALTVTLADVGKTLCVQGTILRTEEGETALLVILGNERGVLYFISYDIFSLDLEEGDCIQASGEIQQLGDTPVLIFSYGNLPEACP